MKLKNLLLTLLCFTICLYGLANGTEPGEPGKGVNELAGSVIHANSKKPLKEVTITAYSESKKEKTVTTDDSGRFGFDELKTGTYKLIFEKNGYRKVIRDKVSIKADETFQLSIEMIESVDFDMMPSPFHFFGSE